MNEVKKSFQPWNLILIVVCVVGFCGGIYLLNLTINTRFDAVDQALTAGMSRTAMTLERIDGNVTDLEVAFKVIQEKMAAPVPPPPPPAPTDEAAAAPAAAAPAPAPAPAKAPAKAAE
jgi:hypothetical protein